MHEKKNNQMKNKVSSLLLTFLLSLALILPGCSSDIESSGQSSSAVEPSVTQSVESESADTSNDSSAISSDDGQKTELSSASEADVSIDLSSIPAYSGDPYVVINDNVPDFEDSEFTTTSFETYSELDSLGRCGTAYACVGTDIMPTEDRESISSVKPTGWQTAEYDNVDGGYLYNRCHLIGFQLTGENANEENLITGTRYMNVDGMLPFENMIADYVKETDNHVLYRVTPIFEGDNLVASGVHMEAESVEDSGEGIEFNVYCYNVQPGIEIDYATGNSWLSGEQNTSTESSSSAEMDYVLNTNTMKFHLPSCSSVSQMSDKNKEEYHGTRESLIEQGYEPCGNCNP